MITYEQLVELLRDSHQKLEAVTDRRGCDFRTAMTLVHSENALKAIDQAAKGKKAQKQTIARPSLSVH